MELRPGTVLRGNKAVYQIASVLYSNDFTTAYRAVATDVDSHAYEVMVVEHFMRLCSHRGADAMLVVPDGLSGDTIRTFREAFARDARVMIEMSEEREGLLLYHEVFDANSTTYAVTDYVVGESLEAYVRRNGPLSLDQARAICTPLHLAVRFLHARNMVHLAICPANIILTRRRGHIFPILTHLGGTHRLAEESESLESLPPLECPLGYSPPEQYGCKGKVGLTTDLYALGSTLFFILTGVDPPRELTPALVRATMPQRIPLIVVNAIIRATRAHPSERTPTITAYRDELLAFYNQPAPSQSFPPLSTDPPAPRRPWRLLLLLAALALLAAGVALLWLIPRQEAQAAAEDQAKAALTRDELLNQMMANMVPVQGGEFLMGADDTPESLFWERPKHPVQVDDFYISRYEVTQELWEAVMGRNPSEFRSDKNPVETVTWHDCDLFVKRLRELTHMPLRLPTEAEWEWAARGGIKGKGKRYAGSDDFEQVAWCSLNSEGHTHPVGQRPPNELGLYDMTGNVWEWTSDQFYLYSGSTQPLPPQAVPGGYSFRGGSWYSMPRFSKVTYRFMFDPDDGNATLGLRLAMSMPRQGNRGLEDKE